MSVLLHSSLSQCILVGRVEFGPRHALKDPFFREVKEADRQRPTTGALESPKKETWAHSGWV